MSTIPVAPPTSMTFRCLQQSLVTWTLVSPSGTPITGMNVAATLYANRSRSNPITQPGTVADPSFSNLSLPETVPGVSGVYQGIVAATFNPIQSTTGFILIITASSGATLIDTWTIPAVIIFPQLTTDLVEIDDVKSWLGIESTNTDDDGILQLLISSFSRYVLNRTGQASFTSVNSYTEIYDGNNSTRLFLRNYPIVSVSSVIVGAVTVPTSGGLISSGWYIDPSGKSIALRWNTAIYQNPSQTIWPGVFSRGQGNIQVTYTAGYSTVPFDLQEATVEAVGIAYARKDWLDLASKTLSSGAGTSGTTVYRAWHLPPGIQYTIQHYTRRALAY